MKILKVAPRGYCKGVVRAITLAKECAKKYPNQTITILGMLVHNRYVIEALADLHIKTIDDKTKTRMQLLDEIKEGIVIFTAHGISPQVKAKAKAKGLLCVDASCPDVMKTQAIVQAQIDQGRFVFYIGKKHHPEAEAICSLSERIYLIERAADIPTVPQASIFVTNQTTMSIFDIEQLFADIRKTYPHAIFSQEICNATRIRQEAVANLAHEAVDILYVVGDPSSNNSNRLAQIAQEHGIPNVYLIDDVYGIQAEQLTNAQCVAVTAGASTPTYLTNQVIAYLENYETCTERPKINISSMLG